MALTMSMIGAVLPLRPAHLEQLKANPAGVRGLIGAPGEVSLEKMWQALHFLLTGSAEDVQPPLGEAILGGTEIGDDVGYGPARYLTPGQVQAIAAALRQLDREELRRRFKPATMTELDIYPMVWDEPEEELFEELMTYYGELAACYQAAATKGDAMLLSLS
jgi:hypothetical protein